MRRLAEGLAVYLRPRVLLVLLLGFSSGIPLALSGSTLTIWMTERGVDLTTIGLLSMVGLPYTFKFAWAPIVDALEVPGLAWLGHRRGWLIASQLLLIGAILYLARLDPAASPWWVALGAVMVAAASATQDIVVDAFRIESLPMDEQAAGMASYVAAYRIAMLVSGAGALAFVAWLELSGLDKATAWPIGYMAMAALVVVGIVATLLAKEPARKSEPPADGNPALRVATTAVSAFTEFLSHRAALAALAFVVLFKLCDALAGAMTGPFVLKIGYDKATYAAIVKGLGLVATLGGGLIGGWLARSFSFTAALWIAAILQMLSNLAFAWLALVPPSTAALSTAVVIESLTGGIGTVVFVAYMSGLCRSPAHTATQFALITAMSSTGRTLLSSGTGWLAAHLGWPLFFASTALAALPSLALLAWLASIGHFRELEQEAERKRAATET